MGSLVGLFESREKAQRAASALREAGFPAQRHQRRDARPLRRRRGRRRRGPGRGVGDGGGGGRRLITGGATGLALGLGALTIPGAGPFLAVGPIVSALTARDGRGRRGADRRPGRRGRPRGGRPALPGRHRARRRPRHRQGPRRPGRPGVQDPRTRGASPPQRAPRTLEGRPGFRYHTGAETETRPRRPPPRPGRLPSTDTLRESTMSEKRTDRDDSRPRDGRRQGRRDGGRRDDRGLDRRGRRRPGRRGHRRRGRRVPGGAAGVAIDDRDYAEVEPEFRNEWERGPHYKESSSWDDASAAYRHGWESHADPALRAARGTTSGPTSRRTGRARAASTITNPSPGPAGNARAAVVKPTSTPR